LKEHLYDEFCKYGRINSIKIVGNGDKKFCQIIYKRKEEADDSVHFLNDKIIFKNQPSIKVEQFDISTNYLFRRDDSTYSPSRDYSRIRSIYPSYSSYLEIEKGMYDEYSEMATRTLFLGNLERNIKLSDIRSKLDKKYGDIIEVDIKPTQKPYTFIQFSDIRSVIKIMRCINDKMFSDNQLSMGFGRPSAGRILWLDGVSSELKEITLTSYLKKYCDNGVRDVKIYREKGQALIYFYSVDDAKKCADHLRGKRFYDQRIMVDFASKELISSRFQEDNESNLLSLTRNVSPPPSPDVSKTSRRSSHLNSSPRPLSASKSNYNHSSRSLTPTKYSHRSHSISVPECKSKNTNNNILSHRNSITGTIPNVIKSEEKRSSDTGRHEYLKKSEPQTSKIGDSFRTSNKNTLSPNSDLKNDNLIKDFFKDTDLSHLLSNCDVSPSHRRKRSRSRDYNRKNESHKSRYSIPQNSPKNKQQFKEEIDQLKNLESENCK
jgi:hypothetical protein